MFNPKLKVVTLGDLAYGLYKEYIGTHDIALRQAVEFEAKRLIIVV